MHRRRRYPAQRLRAALVASFVLMFAAAANAGPQPPAWCQAALQRTAGMYAHCLTRSAALEIQIGGHASAQWCGASLAQAFAMGKKWGLPCPEDPSDAVVRTTLAQCVATTVEHVRDDIGAEATSACDARRIRAAGRYLRCRQRQAARASEGLGDDADAASLCGERLARSWERAAATGPCATATSGGELQSRLDACLTPLSPALTALEGEVTILATFPDGQPRQWGLAIAPTVDSFWIVGGRENVYFAESSLARDLLDHVGDTVRVRGELRVGLEYLRTVFVESFETDGEARVSSPMPVGEEVTIDGTITVVDRYANGHPRRLAVVDAERRATQLAVTNKSQELLFRIGRRMRVDGTRSGMEDLGIHAYTELEGSPLVAAGDGFRMSFLAGGRDENGVLMGGVEVDTLAAFDGKIFAGTSYRKNTQFETTDPDPPGAQVLVLDRPNGRWRADFTVPAAEAGASPRMVYLTTVRFETDAAGRRLAPPIERLAAVSGNGEIYLRVPDSATSSRHLPAWTNGPTRAASSATRTP